MAASGTTKRRVSLFAIASTTATGAGPYEEVFASLARRAPFETEGAFNRSIRVNHLELSEGVWFVELYLIVDRLDILEVSAEPDKNDEPSFLVPRDRRSFATRTCGIFDLHQKLAAIEYVRSGPKRIDFEEILSDECFRLTKQRGAQISLSPIIEENFIKEMEEFERIRQVRVVFSKA